MLIFFFYKLGQQAEIKMMAVLDVTLVFYLLSQGSAIVHGDLSGLVSITFFSLYISIIVHKPANNGLL